MSQEKKLRDQLQMVGAQHRLFSLLLGIMIYQINEGRGDYWRGLFAPMMLDFGKSLDVKVSTAFESALPGDLLNIARDVLQIELPPTIDEMTVGWVKSLIPEELLKKTLIVTVTPKPVRKEEPKKPEPVGEEKVHVGADIVDLDKHRTESGAILKTSKEPAPPPDPEAQIENRPRSKTRFCTKCQASYDANFYHNCPNDR